MVATGPFAAKVRQCEGKKIQQRLCMLEKCILMDSDQLFESSLSC